MKHPSEQQIALYSGGDLRWWQQWRVRFHIEKCAPCRSEVDAYRVAPLDELAKALPPGVQWDRLAEEMTGNIRVGFAAGQCVEPVRLRRHGAPRHKGLALAAAAMVVVLVAGWFRLPEAQQSHLFSSLKTIASGTRGIPNMEGVVLEASPRSIEVKENGGTLSLLHPEAADVTVSVNMQGSAGARYVDADTGQVTINRVYYAQ